MIALAAERGRQRWRVRVRFQSGLTCTRYVTACSRQGARQSALLRVRRDFDKTVRECLEARTDVEVV